MKHKVMGKIIMVFALLLIGGYASGQNIRGNSLWSHTTVTMDSTYSPTRNEGVYSMYADTTARTVSVALGNGVIMQINQESLSKVCNRLTDTIYNGTVVAFDTIQNNIICVKPASNNERHEFLGVTTEDFYPGTVGMVVTLIGKFRNFNTGSLSIGAVYLDTLGLFTNTRPSFPEYSYPLGFVLKTGVSDGIVQFRSDGTNFRNSIRNAFDGSIRETFDFRTYSDGVNVYGVLSNPNANRDSLTLVFSDGWYDYACPDTIQLIPGSATVPQESFVWIDQATRTLQTGTSLPSLTSEYAQIAKLTLLDAVSTQTSGALRNQNINNHFKSDNDNGHIVHIGDRVRVLNAQWEDGVGITVSGTPTNLYLATTSGHVWQMHLQTFDAQNMGTGDDIYIVNHPTTPYNTTTNLNTVTVYSDGSTWNNEWQNLVIWGVCNKTGEISHLMCNLAADGYLTEDDAIEDPNNYANYTIPRGFRGVGFLVARLTVRRSPAGYTYNPSTGYLDLRGFFPNNTAGGGTGSSGITEFTQLNDTPSSYIGFGDSALFVTNAEGGVEFRQILQSDVKDLVSDISALQAESHPAVTMTGTQDYVSINTSTQVITRNPIDLTADVSGLLPDGNIASAINWNDAYSLSHPEISLTSDDTEILNLNQPTQSLSFVSNNLAKLSNNNLFTNGINRFVGNNTTQQVWIGNTSGTGNARILIDGSNGDFVGNDYAGIEQVNSTLNLDIYTTGSGGKIRLLPKISDTYFLDLDASLSGAKWGTHTIWHSGNLINLSDLNNDLVNNNTITLQRNGISIGAFTLNQNFAETFNFIDENTTYSSSDFIHNNLSGLNDGLTYQHITTTQESNFESAYSHSILTTGNPHNVLATQISDFDTEVSNNTDVSANTSSRHPAVTMTGTQDYVSINTSTQVITRNPIDLTTDVTGVLPDANVANNISLDNITQITNRSHTNLLDVGTNTHTQIDSHISNTSNPHSTGLSNLSNYTTSSNITVGERILRSANSQRLIIAGGSSPSSTSGAYFIVEGIDYGGVGNGGRVFFVPTPGKSMNVSAGDFIIDAGSVVVANSQLSDGLFIKYSPSATVIPSFISNVSGDLMVNYNSGAKLRYFGGGTSDLFSVDLSGNGVFTGDVTVSDEAYGVGWNASLEVPTKDAVYDKIESLTAVQSLSGTTPTLNVNSGLNATLTISGNTTITLSNLSAGQTGNITVVCSASGYTLQFSGYTFKISPSLNSASGVITTTATASAIDVYSWWYDGTRVIINGTKNYD